MYVILCATRICKSRRVGGYCVFCPARASWSENKTNKGGKSIAKYAIKSVLARVFQRMTRVYLIQPVCNRHSLDAA